MKREFLTELGIEKETIDKIMSENGVDIEREKNKLEPLQQKISAYETKLESFKGVDVDSLKGEILKLQEEITGINEAQANEKAEQTTNEIIDSFYSTLQEKEFVNDFTKESITNKIKAALADTANKGKGVAELFDSLTKDVEGVFKNPHPPAEIKGAGNVNTAITKDQFKLMGYSDRIKLKAEQPKIYEGLKGEE